VTRRECRFCGTPLHRSFLDLGMSPVANAFVEPEQLDRPETLHPLHAFVCEQCFLVQIEECVTPDDTFGDYAYFSSYSESWLRHAEQYAGVMVDRVGLTGDSLVVEIGSNDGYLLRWFKQRNIPVLGVEPAANVARVAIDAGIPTAVRFFGVATAEHLRAEGTRPDLIVGNNVLSHVPDLNGFIEGLKLLLAPSGIITLEFPHLLRLMEGGQFDTIYHEHYSYFSFGTVRQILATHGLRLFDVESLPTHGGSLRIHGCHEQSDRPTHARVHEMLELERAHALDRIETYSGFGRKAEAVKRELLRFLLDARKRGAGVAGYGAPAKGCTLLNYCGIRSDLLEFTVDRSPRKQGRFLPGTRIPIRAPEAIREAEPDYLLILPWNLRDEIMDQMAWIREWGGRFVVPIPRLEICE